MSKNKMKGVITLVTGLVLIIVALVWYIISKKADWVVGLILGLGVADVAFSGFIFFQKTEEEIIERYLKKHGTDPVSGPKTEIKDTVQFMPSELQENADASDVPAFDPVTGEPLKK